MLAQEEYVEVHALRRRGWSMWAIARHLGRDRKTVRAHLAGERVPRGGPVRRQFQASSGQTRRVSTGAATESQQAGGAGSVRGNRGLCSSASGRRPPPLGDRAFRRMANTDSPGL